MNLLSRQAEYFRKLCIASNITDLKQQLIALKPKLCIAAQKVYDEWDASNEVDGDWQVGFGGICHLIADQMVDVIYDNIPNIIVTTISSNHEVHVFVVAGRTTVDANDEKLEEYYSIDIHPHVYERGSGYSWSKINDVVFEPDDIQIDWAEPLELDENGDIKEI